LKVRLALPSDEDAYVDLARLGHDESWSHLGPYREHKVRAIFARYLADAHPTIFVIEDNGQLVAFLNCTISEFPSADGLYTTQEILFVRPDKRGTRAAALLLRAFVLWSDRLGALESTGGNDNALTSNSTKKLLSRFGFEEVGFFMRRVRGAASGEKGRNRHRQ
jgi:GNAT superfamily N-acetyltransferase